MENQFPKYIGHPSSHLMGKGQAPTKDLLAKDLESSFPVIESATFSIAFPLREKTFESFFDGGNEIDLISHRARVQKDDGIDVDSSFIVNGINQSDLVVSGYEVLLDGDSTTFSCTDGRGQKLEWGNATWSAARCLMREYSFRMTSLQRFLLADDPLAEVGRLGSIPEPIQTGEGWVQSYVDRVNARYAAPCAQCGVSKRTFGPVGGFVPMTSDSKYLEMGQPTYTKFRKPILLEKGIPMSAVLRPLHEDAPKNLRRAMVEDEGIFKGGTLTLRFRLYGLESWGPWRDFLIKEASSLIAMPSVPSVFKPTKA